MLQATHVIPIYYITFLYNVSISCIEPYAVSYSEFCLKHLIKTLSMIPTYCIL